MLVVFLIGIGAANFSAKWSAHEFGHDPHVAGLSEGHGHTSPLAVKKNPAPDALSKVEHQLLHFVEHFQLPLLSTVPVFFAATCADMTPFFPCSFDLPVAMIAPPYRPPRANSLI